MKDQKRTNMERSPGADPSVTMLLRAAYAPPADDAFWAGLEQRIRARLHEQPASTWWSVLSEWRVAGVIAATLALLISGATILNDRALEEANRRYAAEAALRLDGGEAVVISVKSRDSLPDYQPERFLNPFEP